MLNCAYQTYLSPQYCHLMPELYCQNSSQHMHQLASIFMTKLEHKNIFFKTHVWSNTRRTIIVLSQNWVILKMPVYMFTISGLHSALVACYAASAPKIMERKMDIDLSTEFARLQLSVHQRVANQRTGTSPHC